MLLGAELLRPLSLPALRILMGVLFIWFGGLKVAGASPVADMVAGTLPWVAPQVVVPALGAVEVLLALGLVTGLALRLVLPVLAAHLGGTFLTLRDVASIDVPSTTRCCSPRTASSLPRIWC